MSVSEGAESSGLGHVFAGWYIMYPNRKRMSYDFICYLICIKTSKVTVLTPFHQNKINTQRAKIKLMLPLLRGNISD